MSNLTDLLPAGAGGKQVNFVASGTIGNGVTVALNSDGTVEAVGESNVAENVGTASQIASSSSTWNGGISAAFDVASGTHVIFYKDTGDSNKGKSVVATPSGSSLSFGTPVVVDSNGIIDPDIVYADSLEKVLVSHGAGTNNRGKVYVGTVSGTSISFGSAYAYADFGEQDGKIAWSTDDNVFVVVWDDDNNYGESRVGSVSGTTISYGTEVAFETSGGNSLGVSEIGIGYTTGSKVVVAYRDPASGTGQKDSYARVGTISGTSISWGARTLIKAGTNGSVWGTKYHNVSYDPVADKVIISYWNESNSDYPEVIVGTISGTTISFGTSVVVNSGGTQDSPEIVYNTAAAKTVIYYTQNSGAGSFTAYTKLITISGTTPSLSSQLATVSGDDARYSNGALSYDSTNKNVLLAYPNSNSPYGGKALIYTAAYIGTNNTDFIGITDAAISDTASGSVTIKGGISTNVTGLTPNQNYYVQNDGTLNTATSVANYDIASASYTQAFSVSAQVTFPSGVAFNPTGTKMFVVDNTGDDVNEYTLSTGFDVSTASFVDSFSVNAQQAAPMSVAFNTDGTKMYIVGETEDTVAQYALSTGFDVSSASFTQAFSIASQETEAQGITFNTDGTKMFIVGDTGNDINEYTLSSGFDVSTASFVDSFSLASQTTQPKEGVFNTDGTELYVLSRGPTVKVFKYTLTVGFDVSTASYANVEFSVDSQETSPQGLAFSADGSKMYVCGDTGDAINQYATSATVTNSSAVLAGKALSSTSINLDYTT